MQRFFVFLLLLFSSATSNPSRKKRRWVCQEVEFAVVYCREMPKCDFVYFFYLYRSSFGLSPMEQDSFMAHIHSPKLHSIVEVVVLG